MTGVEILASEEAVVGFAFNWLAFWIVLAIPVIGGGIFSIVSVIIGTHEWQLIPSMIVLCSLLGGLIGSMVGMGMRQPVEYETRYKITISDEVRMTDFLEKYEIVESEGKIYTVREIKEETK